MQAFYFQSGVGDAPCAEAPDSGILIQTPEGDAEISLTVNEVNIQLGSTIYMQAQPNDDMLVYVVEGRIEVEAQGTTVTAPAGTLVRIPMDSNLAPTGVPVGPEPYDSAAVANLPISLLPTTITIAEPLTEEEISAASGLPQSGTWSSVITAIDCEIESADSTIGVTVSDDGSTIAFDDGTVLTRSSDGVYGFSSAEAQITLQVVSSNFMTLNINNLEFGCTLQSNLSFVS
jgi:hypothetical protein